MSSLSDLQVCCKLVAMGQSDCSQNPSHGRIVSGLRVIIAFWPRCVSCFVSVPLPAEPARGAAVPLRVRNNWRRSQFFSQSGKCGAKTSFSPSAASSRRCLRTWGWGESWSSRGLVLPLAFVESVYSCCTVDKELLGCTLLWCSDFRHPNNSPINTFSLISLNQPNFQRHLDKKQQWFSS